MKYTIKDIYEGFQFLYPREGIIYTVTRINGTDCVVTWNDKHGDFHTATLSIELGLVANLNNQGWIKVGEIGDDYSLYN